MKLFELVEYLDSHDIVVANVNGKLQLQGEQAALTSNIVAAIRQHRRAVLNHYADTSPVPAVREDRRYPLSFAQRRLFFLQQYDRTITHFNLPLELQLAGEVDLVRFDAAVGLVIGRHDIYRTTYSIEDGVPYQRCGSVLPDPIEHCDTTHMTAERAKQFLQKKRVELIERPFDLEAELPLRLVLVKQDERQYVLICVIHHIATDLWSVERLVKELAQAYGAGATADSKAVLPALGYAAFAQWQVERYAKGGYDVSRSFWLDHLAGTEGILELPLDNPRPPAQTYAGGMLALPIPSQLKERIKQFAARHRLSEHALQLGAYYLLLYKLSASDDLIVGIDVFGREHAVLDNVAGFFVNQLPLRCRIDTAQSSLPYLRGVYVRTHQALRYQNLPFDKLVDELKLERDPAYSPLFQVKFLYQTGVQQFDMFGDVVVTNCGTAPTHSQYDLTLQVESDQITMFYNADLFHAETVERWAGVYADLLGNLVRADDIPLSRVLQTGVSDVLLAAAQGVHKPLGPGSLFGRLDAASRVHCNKIAVTGEEEVSYVELHARVARVQYQLIALGVQRGDKVACFLERSVGMVVAALAIMRCGAVFVPIDPAYPSDYIDFTLQDCGAALVISDSHLGELLQDFYGVTLDIGAISRLPSPEVPAATLEILDSDAAYLLYTSGTTGRPKGVLINHAAFANLCDWYIDFAGIESSSNVLLMIPISFDASLKNIFAPLMVGASLVLADAGVFDPEALLVQIERMAVSVVNCVPSAWHALMGQAANGDYAALRHIQMLALGGEAFDPGPLKPWLASPACQAVVANLYGPTECADISVAYQAPAATWLRDGPVMLGKPIQNVQAVIVDSNFDLCLPGVPGELLIGGVGVGIGYHLRAELTEQHFIDVSYWTGRGYRTGDFCKYDSAGNLYYVGRRDGQIKVRGKRIERNAIVHAMLQFLPGRAIQIELAKRGDAELLLAFISGTPDGHSTGQLKTELAKSLPRHFIPAQFVFAGDMPLTVNGKVSVKALLALFDQSQQEEGEAGRVLKATERMIGDIWSRLLGVDDLQPETDFFSIGGDSIFSIQVVSDLKKAGVFVSVADIFKHPTLAELAACVDRASEQETAAQAAPYFPFSLVSSADRALLPNGVEDAYPLTPLQEGMLFHGMIDSARAIYHDIFKFELVFDCDLPMFEAAIAYVLQANPLLRTAFDMQRYSMPLQLVYPEVPPRLSYVDISANESREQAVLVSQAIAQIKLAPFDIAAPGLIRFAILRLATDRIVFIIDAHHVILDGWSMATVQRQVFERYQFLKQGVPMQDVFDTHGASFAAYVAQQEADQRDACSARYWQEQVRGGGAATISAGWPVRAEAKSTSHRLDSTILLPLHELSRKHGIAPKVLFLVAHAYMLRSLTGGDRVRCVVTDNGRQETDGAQNLVGLFLNVLPFDCDVGTGSWQELVKATQQAEAQRKPHRRYPFAAIVRDNPGFNADAIFTFNNFHVTDALLQSSALEVADVEVFEETNFKLSTLVSGNFSNGFELFLITTIDIPEVQLGALAKQFTDALWAMCNGFGEAMPQQDVWLPRFAISGEPRARYALIRSRKPYNSAVMLASSSHLALQACRVDPAHADVIGRRVPLSWEHAEKMVDDDALANVFARMATQGALIELVFFEEAGWFCVAVGLSDVVLDSPDCSALIGGWLQQLGRHALLGQAKTTPSGGWHDLAALRIAAEQWEHLLGTLTPVDGVQLPTATLTHPAQRVYTVIDSTGCIALRELAQRSGVAPITVFVAAWALVIGRLSGRRAAAFGQHRVDATETASLWTPLRLEWRDDESLDIFLARVAISTVDSAQMLALSLKQVDDCTDAADGAGPLCLFADENTHSTCDGLPGRPYLALGIADQGDAFRVALTYRSEFFDSTTVDRFLATLRTVIQAMATMTEPLLGELPMVDAAQRNLLLKHFIGPVTPFDTESCVHQQFERQVARSPLAAAVVYGDDSLTYQELNERSNRLARFLIAQGVGPDRLVGLCSERSVHIIVGLLAVLKAGGAYVPLDPDYPGERLNAMLTDSVPILVLTYGEGTRAMSSLALSAPCIALDDSVRWDGQSASNIGVDEIGLTPCDLAYVIYTSGSTGRPKGVMVQHRSLLNLWAGLNQTALRALADGRHARIGMNAAITFDGSLKAIVQLLSGHALHIIPQAIRADGAALVQWLQEKDIDAFDCTPSQLDVMCDAGMLACPAYRAKIVLIGGEAIRAARWRALQGASINAYNVYGPTECTVDSTVASLRQGGAEPHIGFPLQNVQCYILDDRLALLPIGSVGELYIGGAGVARGYLNRPELTAERFIADPFSSETGARLYKTGDLGRWLADGSIEYLGRNDFQVKIRGFRIELGEIETCLVGCAGVREAVVLAREDAPGDQRLVAYLVPEEGAELDLAVVRAALAAQLAAFMVPSAFVLLTRLPLTPNGKLDRKALPVPSGDAYASEAYETPQGEVEEKLAAIWAELLQVERVGRQDDFFALGGHSLLAVRLVSRVRQVLGQELALGALFANPVLAQLAQGLDGTAARALPGLKPVPRGGPLALSFAQQRLWFLAQMEGVSQAYHIPGAVRLTGALDRVALERTLDRIVARHEALRTRFVEQDGAVYQVVDGAQIGLTLAMHDLRGDDDAPGRLRALNQAQAVALFDLEAGPLIRASLVCMGEQEHVLLMTMHHIVSDGWSMGVLLNEVSALYGAYVQGRADPLPTLAIQYPDYASWQRGRLDAVELAQHNAYWKQALAGAPALLALPTDRPRPLQQDYVGARLELALEGSLVQQLKQLSQRHGVTLYMTLLAGWAALLARLAGQDEVVVGTPVAGRSHAELEPLIGLFVNTLALRIDVSAQPTVAQLLAQVKQQVLAGQQHQDLPFEQVVELLQPTRSLAHAPLFQTMFAWQNTPSGTLDLPGLQLSNIDGAAAVTAKFDLTLDLREQDGGIAGGIEYACALFDAATVERYAGYWRRLLAEMVTDSGRGVAALPLLEDAERQQLLYGFNATAADYPRDACLHELFEQQVARTPDATALVYEDQALSYAQLNERANRLAHYLRTQGVGPDRLVGICAERGLDMMIGLLATLKAGGAYVPLDPSYPQERLSYMLDDAAVSILLTQAKLGAQQTAAPIVQLCLDTDTVHWANFPECNPMLPVQANHLAYVIYTSGSTGQPKGAMNAHHAVVNRLLWMRETYDITSGDRVLQKTPFSFDVSVWELFLPLVSGACLVMARPEGHKDAEYLTQVLTASAISVVHFVPSMLQAWLVSGTIPGPGHALRHVMCSGETLPEELVRQFFRRLPGVQLHNLYGPTECAVDVTACTLAAGVTAPVTIGKPIANAQMYVLDPSGQPVPLGVVGELHIGGVPVGCGYLNRPELTAERFIADPFSGETGARLYKTGDLGRWLADGSIEYLGRNDFQVKIRGFRIELGEIEACLVDCAGVREAVVLAREDVPGDQRLVAYFVPEEGAELDLAVVRAALAAQLAAFMMPSAFVPLARLPLTPNGKLDRKALPAPDGDAYVSRVYEVPQGEVEEKLAAIWAELLQVDRVGRQDNFFELGGHSLLVVNLVEQMRRASLQVDIRALFEAPTVAALAAAVGGATDVVVPGNAIPAGCKEITPEMLTLVQLDAAEIAHVVAGVDGGAANVQDIYPLAPLQEGILFHHLMTRQGDAYLLPTLLAFDGRARLDGFLAALQVVIDRHDILRTSVAWEGVREPVQVVWRAAPLRVEQVCFDPALGSVVEQLGRRYDPRHHRIDLRQAPLLRCFMVEDAENGRWLLQVLVHHMVSDHTTLEILLGEIHALLQGQAAHLPSPVPFRNFVAQTRFGVSAQEHEAFFTAMLADVDEPTAPFGLIDVQGNGGGVEEGRFELDAGLALRVRQQARKQA
ncbi:amino acid adenylation domain-containing protein [Janthinobacterium lividum]|nr:amino acid adenylation domain-containing protein [Janthinobacterium lividum]